MGTELLSHLDYANGHRDKRVLAAQFILKLSTQSAAFRAVSKELLKKTK